MKKHKIEWLNQEGFKGETWNPVIGCSKVSSGCQNCYAERMAKRQCFMRPGCEYQRVIGPTSCGEYAKWSGRTALVKSAIEKPLRWRNPRKVFVCSMGDLFHEEVPFGWIDRVFAVMASCPHHTFQVLTKRPERMAKYLEEPMSPHWPNKQSELGGVIKGCNTPWFTKRQYEYKSAFGLEMQFGKHWPLANVWLGTSVENQNTADDRIPHLLKCPAAVRFLSCEPLLGPLSLFGDENCPQCGGDGCDLEDWDVMRHPMQMDLDPCRKCSPLRALNWVICGGESGPGARPMHPDWVRSLRDQCKAADVPFLFKQWGEWLHYHMADDCADGDMQRWMVDEAPWVTGGLRNGFCWVGKRAAGRQLDGFTHDEYPST